MSFEPDSSAERLLSLEEIKAHEKEILRVFWQYCQQHKIRMWLAYGTSLEAVRHQDMIPWDDNIDLWMPADDYLDGSSCHPNPAGYDTELRVISGDDYMTPLPRPLRQSHELNARWR